jgi:NADH dehydrogenase
VWAVGDCAAATNIRTGQPSPPTAQFALRQGRTAAQNVAAAIAGRPQEKFAFGGLGQLVSLGGHTGVAELLGRIRLSGVLAWAMWRGFYLFRLPGVERKFRVFLDWLLDLFTSRDLAQLNVQRTERVAMAHYEPGQVIIRQGDPADAFYVMVEGTVQVVREQEDGTEIEVDQMTRGDAFGEVGLLQHRRRTATIRALTPVDVVALTSGDFDVLAHSWEHLGQMLQRTADQRRHEPNPDGSSRDTEQARRS